jgi:hypothetical protein
MAADVRMGHSTNVGALNATSVNVGAAGSEVAVTATPNELNALAAATAGAPAPDKAVIPGANNEVSGLQIIHTADADGDIKANRLILGHTDGTILEGTLGSQRIIGVNAASAQVDSADPVPIAVGLATVVAAEPILAGNRIKCGDNGRILTMNVADTAIATGTGGAFTDQPTDDAVEIVSDDATDIGIDVTIIGTTHGGVVVVSETLATHATDATTAVETVKQNWGVILAIKTVGGHAGTLTIRKKTGPATIKTLATTVNSAGVVVVAAAAQGAHGVIPYGTAEAASTKVVGILYSPATGAADALGGVALNGTAKNAFPAAANLVKEFYIGDVEDTRTPAVKTSATADDVNLVCGRSLSNIAAGGSGVAYISPSY